MAGYFKLCKIGPFELNQIFIPLQEFTDIHPTVAKVIELLKYLRKTKEKTYVFLRYFNNLMIFASVRAT